MVTASKAAVPTISDQASAMQLSQCAKNLASALAELRTASQKVVLIIYIHQFDSEKDFSVHCTVLVKELRNTHACLNFCEMISYRNDLML